IKEVIHLDINQMTYSVQSVIEKAQQLSQSQQLQNIEIEAVLLSALNEDESIFKRTLDRANIDTEDLEEAYNKKLNQYSVVKGDNIQYGQYISPKLNELFNKADKIKEEMQDDFMSMEHLLKAAIEVDQTTQEFVGNKKEIIKKIRGGNRVTSQNPEVQYKALSKYGRDLVEEVRKGKMDPVIGRDEEIRNTIRILSRKTKNNPVLIGEPGVGKTAIVEGLA